MRFSDYLKALLLGAIALGLDVLVIYAAVAGYGMLVEPGMSEAALTQKAPGIAMWTTRVAGPLILLALAFWFCKWGSCRHPLRFALVIFIAYALLDLALAWWLKLPLDREFSISLAIKFAGALLGGLLSLWRRHHHVVADAE